MAHFFQPPKCKHCDGSKGPLREWVIGDDEKRHAVLLRFNPLGPLAKRDFVVHLECWAEYAATNLVFEDESGEVPRIATAAQTAEDDGNRKEGKETD
jgi:hypothetical protein